MKAKNWNPPLEIGDRIILYHMEGEVNVAPGTEGVVTSITSDPFEDDSQIINVKWDNGSTLSLLTSTDAWKKVSPIVKEQEDTQWKYFTENADLLENFDWKWFRNYLNKIRESGIINMFGAAPLLYSGREHIDRYYGEGKEDDEYFEELLDMADTAKAKIVQGVFQYMEKHNKNLDDMGLVNRFATHFSQKMLGLWMTLINLK